MDSNVIGRAVCETLATPPGACGSFEMKKIIEEEEKSSIVYSLLVYCYAVVVGLFILALICICIARRAARKEVNEEVKKSVAHYFSMKEVEALQ